VFDAPGLVNEYVGGYDDWLRQRPSFEQTSQKTSKTTASTTATTSAQANNSVPAAKPAKKLSYKDQREYDALPGLIEQLETQLEILSGQIADPDFYQQEQTKIDKHLAKIQHKEKELEQAFERWEELEELVNG
jgi:ATP-binding cassette subfamily F protein uup